MVWFDYNLSGHVYIVVACNQVECFLYWFFLPIQIKFSELYICVKKINPFEITWHCNISHQYCIYYNSYVLAESYFPMVAVTDTIPNITT